MTTLLGEQMFSLELLQWPVCLVKDKNYKNRYGTRCTGSISPGSSQWQCAYCREVYPVPASFANYTPQPNYLGNNWEGGSDDEEDAYDEAYVAEGNGDQKGTGQGQPATKKKAKKRAPRKKKTNAATSQPGTVVVPDVPQPPPTFTQAGPLVIQPPTTIGTLVPNIPYTAAAPKTPTSKMPKKPRKPRARKTPLKPKASPQLPAAGPSSSAVPPTFWPRPVSEAPSYLPPQIDPQLTNNIEQHTHTMPLPANTAGYHRRFGAQPSLSTIGLDTFANHNCTASPQQLFPFQPTPSPQRSLSPYQYWPYLPQTINPQDLGFSHQSAHPQPFIYQQPPPIPQHMDNTPLPSTWPSMPQDNHPFHNPRSMLSPHDLEILQNMVSSEFLVDPQLEEGSTSTSSS